MGQWRRFLLAVSLYWSGQDAWWRAKLKTKSKILDHWMQKIYIYRRWTYGIIVRRHLSPLSALSSPTLIVATVSNGAHCRARHHSVIGINRAHCRSIVLVASLASSMSYIEASHSQALSTS
ncbi:hypothetical protein U1Q18_021078 [Sarracenia purpurea var. burkii]